MCCKKVFNFLCSKAKHFGIRGLANSASIELKPTGPLGFGLNTFEEWAIHAQAGEPCDEQSSTGTDGETYCRISACDLLYPSPLSGE